MQDSMLEEVDLLIMKLSDHHYFIIRNNLIGFVAFIFEHHIDLLCKTSIDNWGTHITLGNQGTILLRIFHQFAN